MTVALTVTATVAGSDSDSDSDKDSDTNSDNDMRVTLTSESLVTIAITRMEDIKLVDRTDFKAKIVQVESLLLN